MANPTLSDKSNRLDYDGMQIEAEGLVVNDKVVVSSQQANVADAGAITAYTPHASGGTTVTSNAATDLDTTAAALDTLVDEVTVLRTKINDILDILENHGLMAAS